MLGVGCSSPSVNHWKDFVPETTLAVIIPEEDTDIRSFLSKSYIPLFDDISPSAIQLLSTISDDVPQTIYVEGMLLYPDTSNEWQPVWITRTNNEELSSVFSSYQRDFEQNRYEFLDHDINKLFISDRILYTVALGGWTIFSESSIGIENMIRTLHGQVLPMELSNNTSRPDIIINTEKLETFVKQVSLVSHHPFLHDLFKGSSPISLTTPSANDQPWEWQYSSNSLLDEHVSPFLDLFKTEPGPFQLDRYIPVNAAAFALFRTNQTWVMPDSVETTTPLDEYLDNNTIQDLHNFLGNEVGFITFTESGPSNDSEYLYLRALNNASEIREIFNTLEEQNLVTRDNRTYSVASARIGKLFGTHIFPDQDFYLTLYDGVAALSLRKGLAESVGGDSERRRVMYYDDDYRDMRSAFPESLSSFIYADASLFSRYIQPWLFPQHYLTPLLSNFDQFVLTTSFDQSNSSLDITISNFIRDQSDRPFREQWVFPLNEQEITGTPVLADLTGTSRNEVIFSTTEGTVYALAQDGTSILEVTTETDSPIGKPVVYDWYGNNQLIIMQAAGSNIYAWNQNGQLLPNFPIQLNESISSPLIVRDITSNGMAEIIVATADRNLHILNTRGQHINGWPQNTNSIIRSEPLIVETNGQRSISVFSENALHSWNINGERRDGFPIFLPAQLNDSPITIGNHILGVGLDGNLYAIGSSPLFSNTLSTTLSSDPIYIQSLQISNSSLTGTPTFIEDIMVRRNGDLIRENVILLQASNGSVMLYSQNGELIFSQSMGQPASTIFAPVTTDINSDQRQDIVSLADFGRLYAWDIVSSRRHQELPTSAMTYPLIADFFQNGNMEIIAQTREGLQCWTILFTNLEEGSVNE